MKLTIGFSTCPNDTFIFDAIVNKKIDLEGLEFDVIMADVEELNKRSFRNELDITKLSYHAYAYIANDYCILDAGSALGYENGPLFIAKSNSVSDRIPNITVAIPGSYTTANLLFSIAYPHVTEKKEYVFHEIENAINENRVDAGVIIHENRFTYADRGFVKIMDLGEFWTKETGLPIPLGGIVIKRSLPLNVKHIFNRVLRRSIEYAYSNPGSSIDFIKKHAMEIDDDVIGKHIELFVNEYSIDLGQKGKNAIKTLYALGMDKKVIPLFNTESLFLT